VVRSADRVGNPVTKPAAGRRQPLGDSRTIHDGLGGEQPFMSHLVELRDRLLRMVIAIVLVFLVLFPFANEIYTFVAEPIRAQLPEGSQMIATQVASPFLTPFKLALVVGGVRRDALPALPVWAFVAPGLYTHEKRLAVPLLASSIVLFYLGMAFAYFVVFPLVFGFFTSVTPDGVAQMPDIAFYLEFVLKLFFAFGIAFEIPIATILLVPSARPRRKAWRRSGPT
jgi:sec-independent protein translocase protein TatC